MATLTLLLRVAAPAAVAAALMSAPAAIAAAAPATTVYVFTVPPKAATPTEEEQGRLDTVRDIVEALKRNKRLTIVASGEGSQVQVEVIDREKRDAPYGGFGGTKITPLVETMVRLRATCGTHQSDIKGVGQAHWSRAAKDAADRVVRWIVRACDSD